MVDRADTISVEQLTQAAFAGVLAALEAREIRPERFPGPILVGNYRVARAEQTRRRSGQCGRAGRGRVAVTGDSSSRSLCPSARAEGDDTRCFAVRGGEPNAATGPLPRHDRASERPNVGAGYARRSDRGIPVRSTVRRIGLSALQRRGLRAHRFDRAFAPRRGPRATMRDPARVPMVGAAWRGCMPSMSHGRDERLLDA